jgi:FkbM family methyltransferase
MRWGLRRKLGHARRRAFELTGSWRYSRMAAMGIDAALERYLDFDGGFFVEAGANDGVTFSNTYWLERARHWRGLLIEGIPELAHLCTRLRPRSQVVNCALVSPARHGGTVRMRYANLQSIVEDAAVHADHVEAGLILQRERRSYEVDVPARTLSSVLDEAGSPHVDLLVLDVEGYEPEVLAGLDLDRHAPGYALIEALDLDTGKTGIDAVLSGRYDEVDQLTAHDFLYRRRTG